MSPVYQEFLPRPELSSTVSCAWTSIASGRANGVLPDGCVDIVWTPGTEPWVAGPDTAARPSGLERGAEVYGIRFKPGVASAMLGAPISQMLDQSVPLCDVWTRSAVSSLRRELESARDTRQTLAAFENAILKRNSFAPDPIVRIAIARIVESISLGARPDVPLASLGFSERQMRRRFIASVGYGPRMFGRVMRFQRFLRLAASAALGRSQLATLAVEAGYADQPHLTRECASLARCSPRTLMHA